MSFLSGLFNSPFAQNAINSVLPPLASAGLGLFGGLVKGLTNKVL